MVVRLRGLGRPYRGRREHTFRICSGESSRARSVAVVTADAGRRGAVPHCG
jgi:hypothetical protein